MGAQMKHSEQVRLVTASADLDSGDIVLSADGKAGYVTAANGIANGAQGWIQIAGVVDVTAESSDTYSAGVRVYLTEATQVAATSSGAGKILIGVAAYSKTSGQTVVSVDLNGTATSVDDWS